MRISDESLALRAKLFRGLADASRLAILLALREGEKNVSTLVDETGLTQSTVSGHLACLKDCGLVVSRQEWRHVYYRLSDERVEGLLRAADEILAITAEHVARCVNYCADDVKEPVKGGN
ncbi:ArsR/SmtB family transcription factor [Alicyclobacillus shizuokensis]|uniref:ArsR/SmtB family transcription factor n=1 Tax=Alicyclobacillus shizuokensis TaxID=392014 RepID=UPI00082A8EB6|nr:metalloregulator ArsR/SmtB family transcription factor [Alicyclobacillus shizuokensis]